MIAKPELLTTAGTIKEAQLMIESGANAIQIGGAKYGMRLPGDFSLAEINEMISMAHSQGVKIYVSVNKVMSNNDLAELPRYLSELQKLQADAVIFGDPAVLIAARHADFMLPLHWNPEVIATNYAAANYWASKGATRVFLSRELNSEQILASKSRINIEVQVQVHGITNIFHSKRNMVSNYYEHQNAEATAKAAALDTGLFLVEAERRDGHYPVYEDLNGTHIMSSEDICLLECLDELMAGNIDSFKIEGLLKTSEYNAAVVKAYAQVIDSYTSNPAAYEFNPDWLASIQRLQPQDRSLTYGFMYKQQVY